MDKNREARRVTATGNGLSKRRHRAGSFRDLSEDDGPVEFPEAARLRDRGIAKKDRDRDRDRDRDKERERERERDRLNSRTKRRRGDRLMMMQGNMTDGGDDSSEESVNDDEEYDDGSGGPSSSVKMLPPASNVSTASFSSSLSNHHSCSGNHHLRKSFPPAKVFKSSPSPSAASPLVSSWKAAEEMIGVSVPRKARSASTKRPHESWASSATGSGVSATGEPIHRHVSTSPARASTTAMLASPSPPAPTSPSSSSVSVRKKMPSAPKQKPLPPKSLSCKSSSPMAVQDEIEIEIAEVLYGMMSQPLGPSIQEATGNDTREAGNINSGAKSIGDVKSRVTSPNNNSENTAPQSSVTLAGNSCTSNVSAIAPKRKRPRPVKFEDENNTALPSRNSSISSTLKAEIEAPSKTEVPSINPGKLSGSTGESSSVLDSKNPSCVLACPPLMAGRESKPTLDSSPELGEELVRKENSVYKEESKSPKKEGSHGIRSDGDIVVTIAAKASCPAPEKEKKLEIDLMAPPPARASPEREGEIQCVAAEPKPKATDGETAKLILIENDSKTENIGCREDSIQEEPEEKRPRTTVESESRLSERRTELKLDRKEPNPEANSAIPGVNKLNHHVPKQQQQQQTPGGGGGAEKSVQGSSLPLHMSMPGWPGGLPTMGYMAPTQGVVPADTQPPHLFFNQPRPKRCATHCYVARNIHYHQQFTKMNPFWPAVAAGSAPLYGMKAYNLSLMPSAQPEKGSQTSTTATAISDSNQRKPIMLQQALPPAQPNNILQGSGYVFPLGQQPHPHAAAASVRPTTRPNVPGSETQYLAILQNNGYPFHVGPPPAYKGAPAQPMPFYNGSFYPSQMIHPPHLQPQQQSQGQQGQALSNQNPGVLTGSVASQKHVQNPQQRPVQHPGNPQGLLTQKVQSQPLSFQPRQQQQSETGREDSPSTTESRTSRFNVACNQNSIIPTQPTNMGPVNSAAPGGAVAGGPSCNHNDKKAQQQSSKAEVESIQSQAYAMTYATFNGVSAPGLNFPSISPNHHLFHSIPEAARQGYHQMVAAAVAAQQKMNYNAPEDGKSGPNSGSSITMEDRKTGTTRKTAPVISGQSIAFSNKPDVVDASVSTVAGGGIIDTSARVLPASPWTSSSSATQTAHSQQQQQQYTIYLHKQQQYAAAAARSKGGPMTCNGSAFPDNKSSTTSSAGGGKFPQTSESSPVQSPQWKNNSVRTTSAQPLPSPPILSSAAPSLKNGNPKQQGRPQQAQISFAANSKPMGCGPQMMMQQQQGPSSNQSQSAPVRVGSPSTSSVSKSAGGSLRTGTSTSTANKASQPSKNSSASSLHNSSASGRTGSSILGNPHGTSSSSGGSNSQQPHHLHQQQQQQPKHAMHQAQLFFSGPFMQSQQQQQQQQQQMSVSNASSYYVHRDQQQQVSSPAAPKSAINTTVATATSDPAKAKAAANKMKGGSLQHSSGARQTAGKTHHQLVPPGFPYVHAVQVKPAEQKQQSAAGE